MKGEIGMCLSERIEECSPSEVGKASELREGRLKPCAAAEANGAGAMNARMLAFLLSIGRDEIGLEGPERLFGGGLCTAVCARGRGPKE